MPAMPSSPWARPLPIVMLACPSRSTSRRREVPLLAILFDVDLTLVDAHRSGSKAMRRALGELWGWADVMGDLPMAGRTDRAIFVDIIERATGRAPRPGEIEERLPVFETLYYELLESQLGRTPATPCPGIPELLERLGEVTVLPPGLATGNFRRGASLKLASAGIDPARFPYGGFGDLHEERSRVVGLAIEGARDRAGGPVDPVVVGDTPRDHAAAMANDARSALVGTGLGDFGELERLEPDFIAPDLSDTDGFLGWLRRLSP